MILDPFIDDGHDYHPKIITDIRNSITKVKKGVKVSFGNQENGYDCMFRSVLIIAQILDLEEINREEKYWKKFVNFKTKLCK